MATRAPQGPRSQTTQPYAEREKNAKSLEQFRGGEGVSIYIGGSMLAVVLVVVLLVVLL
jgi:hypothetical protein